MVLSQIRAAGEILSIDIINNIFIQIYRIKWVALLKHFNATFLQFTDGLQKDFKVTQEKTQPKTKYIIILIYIYIYIELPNKY